MSTYVMKFVEGETEVIVRTVDGFQRRGTYIGSGEMQVGPTSQWFIGIKSSEERSKYSTFPEMGTHWISVLQVVFIAEVIPGTDPPSVFAKEPKQ